MKVKKYGMNFFVAEIKQEEVELFDFVLCQGKYAGGRDTLDNFYKNSNRKPDLLVNGGYFNMANGETIWTYKNNGKMIMDYGADYHLGIGTIDGKLKTGALELNNFWDFVTGFPVLVMDGKPYDHKFYNDPGIKGVHRRTALGYNKDFIYLVCVDAPGCSLIKLRDFFINELKVDYAVNLDGGGSTRMLREGKLVTSSIVGNRPVDNLIAVYLKKENDVSPIKPTGWRVQVGAFKSKENADNYLKKVHEAGYSAAFVKYVDGYYKIQLGYYSIKNNAERLVEDLREKGFSPYIVEVK